MTPFTRSARLAGLLVGSVVWSLLFGIGDAVLAARATQDEGHFAFVGQAGGAASAVAVEGRFAVIGVGAQVAVVDTADLDAPREVYRSPVLGDLVTDVAVADHKAYVTHGRRLLILDLSQPESPRVLSETWYPFMDDMRRIVVHDGYAYVLLASMSPWGIAAIDVRDPEVPTQVAWSTAPDYGTGPFGWPQDIAAAGRYVYAALGDGLAVVDVTDPARPTRVGYVEIAARVHGVAVAGGHAWLAAEDDGSGTGGGLLVYDVSNPTQPTRVGSLPLPGRRVAVDGPYAYLALASGGLAVVDVADPSRPVAVRTDAFGVLADIEATGGRVHVAEAERGVTVLHGAPAPPAERAGVLATWSGAVDAVADAGGGIAYVAHQAGVAVVDLSEPEAPLTIADLALPAGNGQLGPPVAATHLALAGDHLFASTAGNTVAVVDVADPHAPRITASIATDGPALALAADENRLVVAESARLRAFVVSDPAAPREAGSVDEDGWQPTGLASAGGFAYVADRPIGLRVFALGDSAAPVEVGRLTFRMTDWGGVRGMALYGARLYVPHGPEAVATPASHYAPACPPPPPPDESRVLEIDIADPHAPRPVTDLAPASWPKGLAASADTLYVASGLARYYTTALIARGIGTHPSADVESALPTVPEAVALAGDKVLVAGDDAGLLVALVRPGPVPTATPTVTRPPGATPTTDPNATPSPTPPPGTPTRTPYPTPTSPATPTVDRTATSEVPPAGVVFLPIAGR